MRSFTSSRISPAVQVVKTTDSRKKTEQKKPREGWLEGSDFVTSASCVPDA